MVGLTSKKVTEISISHTPEGNQAWRSRTYDAGELPTGDITNSGIQVDWRRDEEERLTTYDLRIPWSQIGLDTVKAGKDIGISILVNDSDGKDTRRRCLELFSGIYAAKDYRLFGRIQLR